MGSSAAAAAAAAAAADSAQWLSVKEETIFLHDGLIRVTDLVTHRISHLVLQGSTLFSHRSLGRGSRVHSTQELALLDSGQSSPPVRLAPGHMLAVSGVLLWSPPTTHFHQLF